MEIKIDILKEFFDNPEKDFYIRELSKILGINHTTVSQYLKKLVEDGYLERIKEDIYPKYRAKISKKFLNYKLFYNLEKLRLSGIVDDLEKFYDYPVIVLFGSYSHSLDLIGSDIDLCIITEIKKEFRAAKYEKMLGRDVSLHLFNRSGWKKSKEKNPELVNSISQGLVVSGEFEVV